MGIGIVMGIGASAGEPRLVLGVEVFEARAVEFDHLVADVLVVDEHADEACGRQDILVLRASPQAAPNVFGAGRAGKRDNGTT